MRHHQDAKMQSGALLQTAKTTCPLRYEQGNAHHKLGVVAEAAEAGAEAEEEAAHSWGRNHQCRTALMPR